MPVFFGYLFAAIIGLASGAALVAHQDDAKLKTKTHVKSRIEDMPEIIQCKSFCSKGRTKSFDPSTGECDCVDAK